MRPKYKFCFRPDLTSYYRATGRVVSQTTDESYLQTDPIEWHKVSFRYARNIRMGGIFRSFALPLSFPRDGGQILRHVFNSQGHEGVCIFEIWRHGKKDVFGQSTDEYYLFYRGDVDFSQSDDGPHAFKIAIMDRGLPALLKAKETTPFEHPILNSNALKVRMDGVTLQSRQRYTITEYSSAGFAISNVLPVYTSSAMLEGFSAGVAERRLAPNVGVTPTLSSDFLYQAKVTQNLQIKVSNLWINYHKDPSAGSGAGAGSLVQLWARYGQPGAFTDVRIWTHNIFISGGGSTAATINATITVPLNGETPTVSGDMLALYFFFTDSAGTFINKVPSSVNDVKILDDKGRVDLISSFRPAPVTYRGYRYLDLFKMHISAMTGGLYTGVSSYLSNPNLIDQDYKPFNLIASSGDAMRGLGDGSNATTAPKIVTTLEEIHKDSSSRDMTGIGLDGDTVRLEKLTYFYDNSTVIADLGEVTDLSMSMVSDFLYNQFKFGYEPQTNDDIGGSLNGKYDAHNTLTFSSPGVRVNKEWNGVSPYIASMYAVNFITFNLANKPTTDTKNDNKTYLVEISDTMNSSGEWLLARRQTNPGASMIGVLDPATVFNAGLLPKRIMFRNAPGIHTALHLQDGEQLRYQTTDKNADVASNLGTGNVVERANVQIGSLASPLFLPRLFRFKANVRDNVQDMFEPNPNGRINFRATNKRGEVFYGGGFIYDVGNKGDDQDSYPWQLLMAPDTDLDAFTKWKA